QAGAAENCFEIVHVGHAGALQAFMPIAIINLAFLVIAEDGVGLGGFLESLGGRLVPGIAIGMMFHRQAAIGFLDLILGGAFADTQHFVVVPLAHEYSA